MSEASKNRFIGIIQFTHGKIVALTDELTDEQIAKQPSPTAPPIGWHLFHIARWADRLQASFSSQDDEIDAPTEHSNEIWQIEGLSKQWGLDPEILGLLETGAGMSVENAVIVASQGKNTLLEYARRTFFEAEQAVGALHSDALENPRQSILPQIEVSPTGQPSFSNEREVVVINDLIFHISHSSRHLGMIEALRGALFTISGTASV